MFMVSKGCLNRSYFASVTMCYLVGNIFLGEKLIYPGAVQSLEGHKVCVPNGLNTLSQYCEKAEYTKLWW